MAVHLDNLKLLIEAEKKYLDRLDIIDSQISPVWMKQLNTVASDFSELLKCIQDIITVNKSFYEKLIITNSQNDLGELIIHLTKEMKTPYYCYSDNFITNINEREDILNTPSIQQLLNDINAQSQQEKITLETLFYAPLHQLNIYKSLFNTLNINQIYSSQANQLIESLIMKNSLPAIKMESFHTQVDCSNVVNVLTEKAIPNFQMQPLPKVLLCDTFNCDELSKRVQLILTVDHLYFCAVQDNKKYSLLFQPLETKVISIRTIHTDRELIGEYNVQLWFQKQKLFTMKANTKEERNMWLGIESNSSNGGAKEQLLLSWEPLKDIVAKYDLCRRSSRSSNGPKPIRTQDIFTFYTDQTGEISPLVSSSDEFEEDDNSSWEEEEEKKNNKSLSASVDHTDKIESVDKQLLPAVPSFSSNYNTNFSFDQKSLPPPPPPTNKSTIISGTKSLPSRNISLKQLPIPSNMLVPDVITPNNNRPPNVRSLSAHQSMNGRPISYQQQQQHPMPPTNNNSPYLQQNSPMSTSSPNLPSKKPSFMRSVMTAVTSPRSSFRQSKLSSKQLVEPNNLPRTNSMAGPLNSKPSQQSISALSFDQNRYSAASASEPPVLPQHLAIPPPQSPFSQRGSFINNQSTSSFISSVNSSSQSSLTLTPPLSRSSSPGSMTPVILSRYTTPSSSSSEDLGSPPESPDIITHGNTIKNVLYTNNQTKVFHWKDESWYAVEDDCLLEVRQTFSNRSCIAIHLKNSGQFYLNAWVLPDTFITRTTETDLSLSLHIANDQSVLENYLFHCESKSEADKLGNILERMHQESVKMNMVISATSTLRGAPPALMRSSSLAADNTLSPEELVKTFKLAMQCKCKLYVQSASSKWNSFGSVYMKVSQQYATKKMHVAMESRKGGKTTQLVSAMIQSRNVERLGPKRITFLMVDELEKNSVVYMIQVREELTGDKIFEYVKTKNSENGW
ncbi:hypothetical protein BDF21DRAFT_405825 [Thamnidium elegans]|nr:hypothetical protein BDF21DRAFT_405825 [Thamnidium elegans]